MSLEKDCFDKFSASFPIKNDVKPGETSKGKSSVNLCRTNVLTLFN